MLMVIDRIGVIEGSGRSQCFFFFLYVFLICKVGNGFP